MLIVLLNFLKGTLYLAELNVNGDPIAIKILVSCTENTYTITSYTSPHRIAPKRLIDASRYFRILPYKTLLRIGDLEKHQYQHCYEQLEFLIGDTHRSIHHLAYVSQGMNIPFLIQGGAKLQHTLKNLKETHILKKLTQSQVFNIKF